MMDWSLSTVRMKSPALYMILFLHMLDIFHSRELGGEKNCYLFLVSTQI